MRILLPIILISCSLSGYAQTREVDSLTWKRQMKEWLEQCWQYRFNNPDSAKYFGFLALEAARENGFKAFEVDALHTISIVFEAQGNYPRALEYAFEALDLRKELGDESGAANTCNNRCEGDG